MTQDVFSHARARAISATLAQGVRARLEQDVEGVRECADVILFCVPVGNIKLNSF